MRFANAYVRGTAVGEVPPEQIDALASSLARDPAEVMLTGQGAVWTEKRDRSLRQVATALARRNVRSLLSFNRSAQAVADALRTALRAGAHEAEDALDDANVVFNLRHSLFTTPDASLRVEAGELLIANDSEPDHRIARVEIRERGRRYFAVEGIARLVALEVEAVRFAEDAILPLGLQLEAGAVMEPDTAHEHLHKGEWRATRLPHFLKDYCIACARCFVHCPDNAIIHAMFDKTTKDSTGVLGIDYERCTACGICSSVCPADRQGYKAIVMIEKDHEPTAEVHHVG